MRGIPHRWRCGDRVYLATDPRHCGSIVLINSGIWCTIRWDETNFYTSGIRLSDLKREGDHDERRADR